MHMVSFRQKKQCFDLCNCYLMLDISIVGDLYVSQYPNVSLPATINNSEIYLSCFVKILGYKKTNFRKYQSIYLRNEEPVHGIQIMHPPIQRESNTKIVQAKYRPVCVPEHICRLAVAFGGR